MRLATIRTESGTRAVRVETTTAIELAEADVGSLLARPDWHSAAASDGPRHNVDSLDYAPVVLQPEKILCVGLNYRTHIHEMGRELPEYPTLFAKFAPALVGAHDPITLPIGSSQVDWEAELGVIVGSWVRHASRAQAEAAIAGYTVVNDVTARDFQYRTKQWLQGKTFEHSTPVGPWLVTDLESGTLGEVSCTVDGDVMQQAPTSDLVFDAADLIAYLSAIVPLAPGDLIATGTPGGVGHARSPARYLQPNSELITRVKGVGQCRNICLRADSAPASKEG